MGQIFETIMIVCFGISWPISAYKSFKARTAKGKSFIFLFAIWLGYIAGITGKIVTNNITYVFIFYIINLTFVTLDGILYFRNKRIDKAKAEEQNQS